MRATIQNRFQYFGFFRQYLQGRVYMIIGLNLLVGLLDGLGLSMFLPLLQMAGDNSVASPEGDAGRMGTVIGWLNDRGIELNIGMILIFIALFFMLKGVAYYLKSTYQVRAQQYFIKKIRIDSVKTLSQLSYSHFCKVENGRIQNTLTTEIERVIKACQSYFQAVQHMILLLVYVLFAFLTNWQFALMVCIGGMVTNVLFRKLYKETKGVSRQLSNGNSVFQGMIAEFLSVYKYLKATGTVTSYKDKLDAQIADIEKKNTRIGMLSAVLNASREPLSIVVICAVIWLQVLFLEVPLAMILVSLLFFYRALSSLMQYQSSWNTFLGVAGALENTQAMIRSFKENREVNEGMPLRRLSRGIQLEGVRFGYDGQEVLRGVSLSVQKNEFVALVGPSGSGKSTLANLITGLIKPAGGEIRIDGFMMQHIDLATYQKRIGYITQDPVIFSDTLYNNVTLWASRTPEHLERFQTACETAAIWDFVCAESEDKLLGTSGFNLSGGQRQRIAMARELFKNVDLLIMDEATSAMDSATEHAIQEGLAALKGKVTIICIAHRLSTVKNADMIIYLDKGEVVEKGTFAMLSALNRNFKNMVELQTIG